jgi:hypothetical protein
MRKGISKPLRLNSGSVNGVQRNSARRNLRSLVLLTLLCSICFLPGGCEKILAPPDPALKPIQEMLEQQLPPGTPQSNVSLYLSTMGYEQAAATKPGTLVAIIRKIDTEKMEPVTARATFYFDANGKLTKFELQRTLNQPVP